MISKPEWLRCWADSNDQPIVNYLVYSGLLKDKGLKYELVSCNSNVLNMQWRLFNSKPKISEFRYVMSPDPQNQPAILHQYNRFPDVMNKLGEMCYISFQRR